MNELEDIKDRIDIVELISSYITIKKAGRNYKAVCPFHKEKTPSFMISPEKQIWHCFGCQKGGDIFGFTMEMEGMDFPEALKFLAKKAGVTLQRQAPSSFNTDKKSELLNLNNLAASFYHKVLEESREAQVARDYLKKRGVDKKTIIEFRLGYSPQGFRTLTQFLEKRGGKTEDIIKAGLAVKRDNGEVADRFYKRLMFPIINPSGAVLGFTARILTNEKDAKYINTPETPVYEKSRALFGLDKAKKEVAQKNWLVIVEGNMDVISSFEAGVKNAVASSGTALTREQIKIIKRYTPNIILSLDKDEAGSEALKRGIFIALEEGMNIKVLELLEYKDPDEMIKADKNLWKEALKNSKHFLEFYFDKFFGKINKPLNDITLKKRIAREILPFLKRMQNSIEKAHYIKELSKRLNVPEASIVEALNKTNTEYMPAREKEEIKKPQKSAKKILSETLLGLILSFPVTVSDIVSLLEEEDFEDSLDKKIFKEFEKVFKETGNFDTEKIKDKDFKSYISELMFVAEENHKSSDNEDIFKDAKFCFKRFKYLKLKDKKDELKFKIEEAEKGNEQDKLNVLMKELQEVLIKEKEIKEF